MPAYYQWRRHTNHLLQDRRGGYCWPINASNASSFCGMICARCRRISSRRTMMRLMRLSANNNLLSDLAVDDSCAFATDNTLAFFFHSVLTFLLVLVQMRLTERLHV